MRKTNKKSFEWKVPLDYTAEIWNWILGFSFMNYILLVGIDTKR